MVNTVYVDSAVGSDAYNYLQAQNPSTPWKGPLKANASATANDVVNHANGTYPSSDFSGATEFAFTKQLALVAAVAGAARLISTGTAFVARISGSMPAGTLSMNGMVLNGENKTNIIFQIGANDAVDYVLTSQNTAYTGIKQRGISAGARRGTINSTGDTYSASANNTAGATVAGIISPNNDLGAVAAAPFVANVVNPTVSLPAPLDAQVVLGFSLVAASARLSACNYSFSGGFVDVTAHPNSYARGIEVIGGDGATVTGTNFHVKSTGAAECVALRAAGRSASATANNVVLDGQGAWIDFDVPAGFAIALGDSQTTGNFMTNGLAKAWNIVGRYWTTATPHGIVVGEGTDNKAAGIVVYDLYAPLLMSKTIAGAVHQGNRAIDYYGSAQYTKGAAGGSWVGCSGEFWGKWTQRNLAAIHVDSQNGVDTTAILYDGSEILIGTTDRAKWTKLIGVKVNNSATLTNCIFIVPDTVADNDVVVEIGCTQEGKLGGGTNYTLAQLAANTIPTANGTGTVTITGAVIVKLPIAQIMQRFSGLQSADAIYHNGVWYSRSGVPLYPGLQPGDLHQ